MTPYRCPERIAAVPPKRGDSGEQEVAAYVAGDLTVASLVGMAVIGVITPHSRNYLPVPYVLDFLVILVLCLARTRLRPPPAQAFLFVFGYVVIKWYLMAAYNPSNLLDFAQAYKAFIYAILLCLVAGKVFLRPRTLARGTVALLFLFLAKYAYAKLFMPDTPLGERPGIYYENNYELMLLIGMVYLAVPYLGRFRHPAFLILSVIVMLSESRSASVGLLVVAGFIYLRPNTKVFLPGIALLTGLAISSYTVFEARLGGSGVESIDRYRFLMVFLDQVGEWPLWEFFTGSFPLTPMSPESCFRLAYYQSLFSMSGNHTCYSVILHSFILRTVIDHGIFGLAAIYWLAYRAMRSTGGSRKDVYCLLGVITADAVSVSGFNSEFAVVLILLTLGLDRRPGTGGETRSMRAGLGSLRTSVDHRPTAMRPGPPTQSRMRAAFPERRYTRS